jgi:Ala-tRNA(Pro) deacylase
MPATKLKAFLDEAHVKYITLQHSPAFTAAEVAASAHLAARGFAKTLIMHDGTEMIMVVLPASRRLILHELRELFESDTLRLATEAEFLDLFPDCELGAMPPFGNLYGMRVYVTHDLARQPEIAFNAGTHTDVIQMPYADFDRLVRPQVLEWVTT